jgi:hypothetical protein
MPLLTPADQVGELLVNTSLGYLRRSLDECTPEELEVIERWIRRARLDRSLVRREIPLSAEWCRDQFGAADLDGRGEG